MPTITMITATTPPTAPPMIPALSFVTTVAIAGRQKNLEDEYYLILI